MKKKTSKPKTAPTRPTPEPTAATISGDKLADLTGLSPRRIYQLADEGRIPPSANGVFPMFAAISALFAIYRQGNGELKAEKLRQIRLENEKLERLNRLAAGEIVTVEDAAAVQTKIVSALVQDLDSIPSMVPGLTLEQRQILLERLEIAKERGRQA